MSRRQFTLGLSLLLFAIGAAAQELTPRAYWPAPVGTSVGTIGYSHVSGNTIPDPSLPVTGVDSDINVFSAGFRHTTGFFGRSTNLILEIPYSDGETVANGADDRKLQRGYQGLGDVSATIAINLIGAPAMDAKGFSKLRANPSPILGGSLKIVAPTGDYDNNRAINVGSNRWAAKAELGYIAPLHPKWLIEVDLGWWILEDNDNFLGFKKEQDSISSAQIHLIHRFARGFWMSLDANYYKGGRSTVDDIKLDDLQRHAKVGATLVYPFAQGYAVKLGYAKGSVNRSDEDADTLFVSLSHIF